MISAWWLLLFIPAAFGLGMLALALVLTAGDQKASRRSGQYPPRRMPRE